MLLRYEAKLAVRSKAISLVRWGTRLTEMVKENLQELQIRVNYWTDSTIVINWLHAQPFKMKTFIRNRIVEIQKAASPLQWMWLPEEDNPADILPVA